MNGLAWSKVHFRWLAITLALLAAFALVACTHRTTPTRMMLAHTAEPPPPSPPPPPPPPENAVGSSGPDDDFVTSSGPHPTVRRRVMRGSRPPVAAERVQALAAHEPVTAAAQTQVPPTDTGHGEEAAIGDGPGDAGSADAEPVDDEAAANDRALKYLHDANIAFNTPQKINRDETADVVLVLSRKESIAALKGAIGAEVAGGREGASIKTASRMEAKLSGLGFDITPATGIVQAVGTQDRVIWTWQVRPKATGAQTLTLTLTAKLDKHGVADKTLQAFTRRIDVEVTPTQVVGDFVGRSWQWLWGAILVPLAAAGRAWYTSRKRKEQAA